MNMKTVGKKEKPLKRDFSLKNFFASVHDNVDSNDDDDDDVTVCTLKIFDLISACALLGLVRQKHIDSDAEDCTVTAEFG